ncbi:MAG: HRDC domain-containing protein [Treponema sp.]|jgi:superfamily II DNA helicase RecQ|nr:HRDC domain-containing protein [Treponema sp.]
MALLTQYRSFFISPFGEPSICDELNAFLKSHRIVNVEKRLVDGERGTGWLFLVEYGQEVKNSYSPQQGQSQPRVDYRDVLSDQDFALFDKARQLRKSLSEKQGLPAYAVFTNEQLAAMIKNKAKTVKDIASIPGVGDAKVRQYAGVFLKLIADHTPAPAAAPAAASAAEQPPESEAAGEAPELSL